MKFEKINIGNLVFLLSFLILVVLSLTLIVLNNRVTASGILQEKGNMSAPKIHTHMAIYEKTYVHEPLVVVSGEGGRLITGQNPESATNVGEKIVEMLNHVLS